jgi:AraC family transcriptional regulator
MLRYLGFGRRQFGRFPIKPYARINWEFFAVVRGRCAPQQGEHDRPALRTATLWVTAPGSAHTWAAQGTQTTDVAVFHFGSVPAVLQACVRKHGQLAVPLRAAEARRVAALARSLERHYQQPNGLSPLVFQAALIELTLLALRKLPAAETPLQTDHGERIVERAGAWYAENIAQNPSITDVAREVHVSPSTLRRLFRRLLREKPARAFARLQIEKSMRLMTETDLKLEGVAAECGYTSSSDFCRAFKAFTRVSPTAWRRLVLSPPRAGGETRGARR